MQYEDFHESVLYWAKIRGFDESDPRAQYLSCVEESVKEISEAKMTLDDVMLSDAIGDTAVTLIILEMQLHKRIGKSFPGYNNVVVGSYPELMFAIGSIGANLRREKWYEALEMVYFSMNSLKAFCIKEDMYFDECCGGAWDEIKDRNGLMINGSYVKEADFTDEQARLFEARQSEDELHRLQRLGS